MTSLSKNARVAGLLYIVASVVGVVRLLYIPKALFVDGNATATANNIVAHESLFRLGIVSYLLASVLWLFVPLALYRSQGWHMPSAAGLYCLVIVSHRERRRLKGTASYVQETATQVCPWLCDPHNP